jgi:glycosyltransferase involved in cell wall biosynthesis
VASVSLGADGHWEQGCMRIALIDPSLFTWPYDVALADGLEAAGHEVAIFGRALGGPTDPGHDRRLRQHFYGALQRRPLVALPRRLRMAAKGVSHIAGWARLSDELRTSGCDVAHFQWTPLPVVDRWFLPALRRRMPIVLTVHDSAPFNDAPGSSIQRLGATQILRAFDRVIVHTERGRGRLLQYGMAADRITQIAHGLLHGGAARVAGQAVAAPADDDRLELLQFGQIKPYKGVDVLIRATALLPATLRERLRVRVVGRPLMDVRPLLDLARSLGVERIFAFEFRHVAESEIEPLFAGCHALVMPYREIDASGVLMTALTFGRPVVASAIGAFAEMLEDGRHGLLVPPDDPASLAAAVAALIADPVRRRRMAAEIGRLGGSVPSWTAIAEQTVSLYRRTLRERAAGPATRGLSGAA